MFELTKYQQYRLDIAVIYGAALVGHGDYAHKDAAEEAVAYADALLDCLGIVDPDQS